MTSILSYSAGSLSRNPHGFREIDEKGSAEKIAMILRKFPAFASVMGDFKNVLLINAYPATLGGLSNIRSVDTYLHPPTFQRALSLTAIEGRDALFLAQPLMAAEMIRLAIDEGIEFPKRLVWSTGGYPLPKSLERAIRSWLADKNCELMILHCYGIAQLDHSLMVAMDRDHQGRLIYHCVHPELKIDCSSKSNRVISLHLKSVSHLSEDRIVRVGQTYRIDGDPKRQSNEQMDFLESWSVDDWRDRTGYLGWSCGTRQFQQRYQGPDDVPVETSRQNNQSSDGRTSPNIIKLDQLRVRENQTDASSTQAVNFHSFAARFGMTWHQKPIWKPTIKQQEQRHRRRSVAA